MPGVARGLACLCASIAVSIRLEHAVILVLKRGDIVLSRSTLSCDSTINWPFPGSLHFAESLISISAQTYLLCQVLKASLQSWSENVNGSPPSVPWLFAWGCMAQASGITYLTSSVVLDATMAAIFLTLMQRGVSFMG